MMGLWEMAAPANQREGVAVGRTSTGQGGRVLAELVRNRISNSTHRSEKNDNFQTFQMILL